MPVTGSLESHGQESFVGAADTRAFSGVSSSHHPQLKSHVVRVSPMSMYCTRWTQIAGILVPHET